MEESRDQKSSPQKGKETWLGMSGRPDAELQRPDNHSDPDQDKKEACPYVPPIHGMPLTIPIRYFLKSLESSL